MKPKEKRKVDLGGVPAAAIKGANMAVGAGLNFLPAFILKFQVRGCITLGRAAYSLIRLLFSSA